MSYNELIKSYSRIRDYMREFFVYGFKSRSEYEQKSARSYDNEKRRIESWLSDYMAFHQDSSGKNVFLSVDSRRIPHNPLYQAWKAASFTKNDISLHFLLLDILSTEDPKSIPEIMDIMDNEYLPLFSNAEPFDESTLRKKLREYVKLGLVVHSKQGRQLTYTLPDSKINLSAWQDALEFFSEENPLGIVGSFLMDKIDKSKPYDSIFSFKHHYLLFTLDSGVINDLLIAIHEHRKVELQLFGRLKKSAHGLRTLPLKFYISTQGGRQYVAGYNTRTRKINFYRLDAIQKVTLLEVQPEYEDHFHILREQTQHIWGVSSGRGLMEHLEMRLSIDPEDTHIIQRLKREKRCGHIEQTDETTWMFKADVYDAQEMLPWLRTFIGRVESLTCSDPIVTARFWSDYALMKKMYGGEGNAL